MVSEEVLEYFYEKLQLCFTRNQSDRVAFGQNSCETCSEKETIQHFIFHCQLYHQQRPVLEREIEEILARNGITQPVINLKVLSGNLDEISRNINLELKVTFGGFLRSTWRLIKNQ